jgi:hypothetical protein
MKNYLEFLNFLNEGSGKEWLDVFDMDKPFNQPVYQIKKSEVVEELAGLISRRDAGYLQKIIVYADIPRKGKTAPEYLADVLPTRPEFRTPDPEDRAPDWEPPDWNVFVDVEFEVIDLDRENNKILAYPISLKKKNITTPLNPNWILEVSFSRKASPEKIKMGMSAEQYAKKMKGKKGKYEDLIDKEYPNSED